MGRLEVCEHIKDCADGKGMMGASIVMTTCAGVEGILKLMMVLCGWRGLCGCPGFIETKQL